MLVEGRSTRTVPASGSEAEWKWRINRKPKYRGLGTALGAALGAVAGVMAGNVGVWLAVGVAIGVAIGLSARPKTTECPECEALHRTHRLRSGANSQVGWK